MSATTEQMAIAIGNSRTKLRARLLRALSILNSVIRAGFRNARFDFEGKRLISDNGKVALQWHVRDLPDQPESYVNQQTTTGTVHLERA